LEEAVFVAVRERINAERCRAGGALPPITAEGEDRGAFLHRAVDRVVVKADQLHVSVNRDISVMDAETQERTESDEATEIIKIPFRLERRGGTVHVLTPGTSGAPTLTRDTSLIKAVVRGHEWARRLLGGEAATIADLAREAGVTARYVSRIVRYAFLAPDITEAILSGTQSSRVTVESLRALIPLDWSAQREAFGATVPK
jgi:hypothetical protein